MEMMKMMRMISKAKMINPLIANFWKNCVRKRIQYLVRISIKWFVSTNLTIHLKTKRNSSTGVISMLSDKLKSNLYCILRDSQRKQIKFLLLTSKRLYSLRHSLYHKDKELKAILIKTFNNIIIPQCRHNVLSNLILQLFFIIFEEEQFNLML